MKMKHFFEYLVKQKDDFPIYLSEDGIERHRASRDVINSFESPSIFKEDLLGLLGKGNRPPYRNFNIFPTRSGVSVQRDPLMNSFWDVNLHGRK